MDKKEFRDILYSCGLRNTPERYAILQQMYQEEGSFSATDIYYRLDDAGSNISLATVFNVCNLFCRLGLIEKIPTTDNVRQFILQKESEFVQ